jgi:DinB superfamily
MELSAIIHRLEQFCTILPVLVKSTPEPDARWRPESGNWSILEIVCHLADEEVEDFRQRVQLTLQDTTQAWPSINPPQAAIDRKYNEQKLSDALSRFVNERTRSVQWLRSLDHPDWNKAHHHPKFGPITAGQLLASWVAHDQLHLRQIAKRFYEQATRDAKPFTNEYAGGW